ncbi:3-dehydroquinate synthase family protein [Candidatus Vidania fulgoroideorum]
MTTNKIIFIKKNNLFLKIMSNMKNKYFIIDYKFYNKNNYIKDLFFKKNFYFIKNSELDKNIIVANNIIIDLLRKNFRKDCNLISIGGGVTGDIGGFVASIYFRGINFINVPTTLLSMVDSSIGGKNALNIKENKNIIGTIYLAKYIIICSFFLKTLSIETYKEGLSEIIKIGIINNKKLFFYLNKRKVFYLNKLIFYSIISKIEVFKKDLYDKNLRMILNLGHTFAHSIEKISHNKISHGKAVFLGLFIIAFLSYKFFYLKKKIFFNIILLLRFFFRFDKLFCLINFKKLYNNIKYDKKNFDKYLKIILIGNFEYCFSKKIKLIYLKKLINKEEIISELVKLA